VGGGQSPDGKEGGEETDREKEIRAKAGDVNHEVRVISLYKQSHIQDALSW